MRWFRKKNDALSERARMLEEQILAVEERIRRLSEQTRHGAQRPVRSPSPGCHTSVLPCHKPGDEPVFVNVGPQTSPAVHSPPTDIHAELYNDLGVRKFDLARSLKKLRDTFRGPAPTNPQLVHYLAVGSVQGLRPLRKEKRIARNRFLLLVACLTLLLWGALAMFLRQ